MANPYYNPGGRRAEGVHALFATVARHYDLMNDVQSAGMHRWWKRRLVRLARVRPGEPALDLCCGTGDIAFALAREGASVVGLDFNEPMLEVAEARRRKLEEKARKSDSDAKGRGLAINPRFQKGDAQAIPFPDNTFAVATVGTVCGTWRAGRRA